MSKTSLKLAYDSARAVELQPDSGGWPEPSPLPRKLLPVPAFEPELLPLELRPWALDISDRMQVPLDFTAIPAMVAAGSLIGRRMSIRPEKNTQWTEVGNLWGCLVAPPGAMKSPAMGEALEPIRKLEAKAAAGNDEAAAEYKTACLLHKLEQDSARDRAKKEIAEGARDVAQLLLREVVEPDEPRERRFMTTDATVEKLGEICADNPDGLLVYRDELLTMFQDLNREEKATARGFLLSGWGGRDNYTVDRIGRGTVRIPCVNLSVVGTTQPARISRFIRESLRSMDDGMVQRLQLLAWPDSRGSWKRNDRHPNSAARTAALACFERLANLDAAICGGQRDPDDDGSGVPYLRFAPAALERFEAWRDEWEPKLEHEDAPAHLVSHFAKYRGVIPRIALIYHLANGGTGPVDLEACLAALAWGEYLKPHAERAYDSTSLAQTDTAEAIWRRIKRGDLSDGFTVRDVYRPQWSGLRDKEAVQAGLDLLADYDWIRMERLMTGGRPSSVCWINPKALR